MQPCSAVIIGASGGVGAAWVEALRQHAAFDTVLALSRSQPARCLRLAAAAGMQEQTFPDVLIDLTDEASIVRAAALARELAPVRQVIVATGLLHADDGLQPEKSMRALNPAQLHRLFAVNAVGPALVARHFMPLMPRQGRVSFAALSARVGSISDNRLGGWYGYRASKAALNQLIRTLAIEWSRTAPESICVGLHPGTVDTALSQPFQRHVADERLFTPTYAASRLIEVMARLGPSDSGRVFAWDGSEVPA